MDMRDVLHAAGAGSRSHPVSLTEKRQLVRRLQAGKARARQERPARLARIEAQLDELGRRHAEAATPEDRAAIVRELRPLGVQRTRLKWGE